MYSPHRIVSSTRILHNTYTQSETTNEHGAHTLCVTQVLCPQRSTVQTSMNTPGAQTCHTTASHLIEHAHTHTCIVPSSTNTGTGGAPPHTLIMSGSANGQAHACHFTDCARNHFIHIAFSQYLERNMKQTHTTVLSQSIMFQIKNITHNTKLPNTVHALCRLTYCSLCIVEDTVE